LALDLVREPGQELGRRVAAAVRQQLEQCRVKHGDDLGHRAPRSDQHAMATALATTSAASSVSNMWITSKVE
jgi:hypothetical protein